MIGRAREREALSAALAAGSGVVVLEGEPGIGKSRLLAWAAEAAAAEVLSARASEYEADLPYGLWIDALGDELVVSGDRHRTHGALRARLEARAPLVVCLDDVHWADPASVDALAALVHRPPAGDVLLVLATRTGQLPRALGAVAPIRIGPLSEARGARAGRRRCRRGLRRQRRQPVLPRAARPLRRRGGGGASGDGTVPPAVAAALTAELGSLGAEARRLLDAAAVVGDPFELDLAAAVAELGDAALTPG